jgi:hypothetical protein
VSHHAAVQQPTKPVPLAFTLGAICTNTFLIVAGLAAISGDDEVRGGVVGWLIARHRPPRS